ncbi:mCG131532, isoform CRA_a [Mus musculus]|nr:mCG131532, isoform CRA_a [Mus musculus]
MMTQKYGALRSLPHNPHAIGLQSICGTQEEQQTKTLEPPTEKLQAVASFRVSLPVSFAAAGFSGLGMELWDSCMLVSTLPLSHILKLLSLSM